MPAAVLLSLSRRALSLRHFHLCRLYATACTTSSPLPNPTPICRPPWILLPRTKEDESSETCRFYSVRDDAIRPVPLPRGLRYTCCLGSSPDGWLVLLGTSYTPVLFNPVTGFTSKLPSIDNLEHLPGISHSISQSSSPAGGIELNPLAEKKDEAFAYKAPSLDGIGCPEARSEHERVIGLNCVAYRRQVPYEGAVVSDRGLYFGKTVVALSSPPSGLGYTAVGIYGREKRLAIAKAEEPKWSALSTRAPLFQDVIHHKGWFYAVHEEGSVEAIDPAVTMDKKTELLKPPVDLSTETGRRYLVQSGGDLLLINRLIGRTPIEPGKRGNGYRTIGFEVFKLDLGGHRWIKIDGLANMSLFIGGNHSVSLSADEFPELKGNSIYFMDDYWEHSLWFDHSSIDDFGVFDLTKGRFEGVVPFEFETCKSAPIWVIPPAAVCDSVQLPKNQEELTLLRKEEPSYRAPWLLFPRSKEDEDKGICRLYSVQDRNELTVHLPRGLRWRCCLGSSNGWLVTVDSMLTPHLTNPLTGFQIELPSIEYLPGTHSAHKLAPHFSDNCIATRDGLYFGKAAVSLNTSSSAPLSPILPGRDHTVVAIQGHDRKLVCAREGDWSWSMLKTEHSGFQDVMHYNGMFYAVTGGRGFIEAFDLNGYAPDFTEELLCPKTEHCPQKRYLVESSDNLLLVIRMITRRDSSDIYQFNSAYNDDCNCSNGNIEYKTSGFKIFKLKLSERKWNEINNLGEQSLILGSNQSISLSVSDYPELRSNCIYFTDDHWERDVSCKNTNLADTGIFSLADRSIEHLTPFDSHLAMASPTFVIPSQHKKDT